MAYTHTVAHTCEEFLNRLFLCYDNAMLGFHEKQSLHFAHSGFPEPYMKPTLLLNYIVSWEMCMRVVTLRKKFMNFSKCEMIIVVVVVVYVLAYNNHLFEFRPCVAVYFSLCVVIVSLFRLLRFYVKTFILIILKLS